MQTEGYVKGMNAAKRIQLVSVEDYLAGELRSNVKHEYTGGYVYAMAGAKNVHNAVAVAFNGAMYSQLRGRPCQPFNSDTKVRVRFPTHTRFYYPDGMVVCKPNPANDTFQDEPVVIAEVVSEATRRIDEGEKRDAYVTIPTLMVYLVIETDRPRVVAHRRTENGFVPEVYEENSTVVPLTDIGAELSLSELYARVEFGATQQDER